MLAHVLSTPLRSWLDERRWRRAYRMELAPFAVDRLWADGYGFNWRFSGSHALGRTIAGDRVVIPVEEFVARFLA